MFLPLAVEWLTESTMAGKNILTYSANTWLSNPRLTKCSTLLLTVIAAGMPFVAAAQNVQTAALTPGSEMVRESDLPAILSARDTARYRTILALQEEAQWRAADDEIGALRDPLLLGHVLAQCYVHRTYPAKFNELRD